MRVLLLEDDVALNDLLNEHLIDKGYDVDEAYISTIEPIHLDVI